MASPEIIRVGAVQGVFALVPGSATHGAQVQYVGRRTDLDAIKANSRRRVDGVLVLTDMEACFPIDASHNSTFNRFEGSGKISALGSLMRSREAVPLDEATATWVGVRAMPAQAPAAPIYLPPEVSIDVDAEMAGQQSTPDTRDE